MNTDKELLTNLKEALNKKKISYSLGHGCLKRLVELAERADILGDQFELYTEADLVSFGKYLLSDERWESIWRNLYNENKNVTNNEVESQQRQVHDADLSNWRESYTKFEDLEDYLEETRNYECDAPTTINEDSIEGVFIGDEEEWLNEIVEARIQKLRDLLINKGAEYARDGNKFHNFDRASELNDSLPARELHGFLTKHLVSYMDMLDDMENGEEISEEKIDEKFGDIITYFVLQEALFYRDAN